MEPVILDFTMKFIQPLHSSAISREIVDWKLRRRYGLEGEKILTNVLRDLFLEFNEFRYVCKVIL